MLNIQRWAIEDLNVTPYPETRVYKRIASVVCGMTRYPAGVVLLVRQRMFWSTPETGYRAASCSDCPPSRHAMTARERARSVIRRQR